MFKIKIWAISLLCFFMTNICYGINSTIIHYTYKHLYGLTWQLTTNIYVNCDYYGTFSPIVSCAIHDTCNYQTKFFSYANRVDTLPNGMPYLSNCYFNNCAGTHTMCDAPYNATGLVAWRQVVYLDTITLPEPCGLWKFSRGAISPGNYRDPMITNITPNTYTYYYEAILHADSTMPNSSAVWKRPMFMYAYADEPTQWHLPITDPDGDSLVYSHVAPRRRNAQSPNPLDTLIYDIPFVSPYSVNTEPFNTYETWHFDPSMPAVRFTGAPNQLAVVCFKVEEYRQGVYMGATFRDVLIHTIPVVNMVPRRKIDTLGLQNVLIGGDDTITLYTGQAMNMCTKYYSSSNAELQHESNISTILPNANYTSSNISGDSILTCLQWTPTLADTGMYLAVTTLTDTSCTATGPRIPQDYFHRIQVKQNPLTIKSYSKDIKYNLYPNPAQSQITIDMPLYTPYIIYNSMGSVVYKGSSQASPLTQINVADYNNGVYFIRFKDSYMSFNVVK